MIILQIYNEQITDLLDPSQGNLQVKIYFAFVMLFACNDGVPFFYRMLLAYVVRLEKMWKQEYMLIIWPRKMYVQWRMLSGSWIR